MILTGSTPASVTTAPQHGRLTPGFSSTWPLKDIGARVDFQLITLLKDYWLPIVGAIAALAFSAHHKISALLEDNDDEE